MKKTLKICMLTTSDIRFDSRILNEAYSLSKKYHLTIISRVEKIEKAPKYPFKVRFVSLPKLGLHQLNVIGSLFKLTCQAFQVNPQIYHAHDLDGLLCALLPALVKRKKLVYDSHELWTGLYNYKHLKGLQWLLPVLERFATRFVEKGITVNQTIAAILKKKYQKEFVVLQNVSKYQKIKKNLLLQKQFPGEILVLHIGTGHKGRGGQNMIKALKYLPTDISLVFLGSEEDWLMNFAKELGLEKRVHFLQPVPPNEVVSVATSADLGLSLTENLAPSFYYSLPNKIFQYIAAGVPVLGSNFPEFKKVILENKIGEVVNPQYPQAIAKKIKIMLEPEKQKKYRVNLLGLAKNKYNWALEEKKLFSLYQDLL